METGKEGKMLVIKGRAAADMWGMSMCGRCIERKRKGSIEEEGRGRQWEIG